MSWSNSHSAVAYLWITSSKRWPPGLAEVSRQTYPSASRPAWKAESVCPTTVFMCMWLGRPMAPSTISRLASSSGG